MLICIRPMKKFLKNRIIGKIKEALWKHRWYAGSDGHGSSNGNYKLNRNDEYFLCNVNKFGDT